MGELVVGIEGTYPSYTYHGAATDKLTSYDAEVIAEKLGMKVQFVE